MSGPAENLRATKCMNGNSGQRLFLDTNVLVYALDPRDRRKQRLARAVIRQGLETRNVSISYQVIQEFLNLATRRFEKALAPADVRTFLDGFLWPICEVFPDPALYLEALSIR